MNSTRQAPYISNLDVWYHDGFWHQQASPATWWRIWTSILNILSNSFPTLVKAEDDIPCKRSTVKLTFTPSIHTNQQLECITLVQWTSARITRLTTFKVTRFSSSFSIPACESISTWATLKMFREVNPGRSCL